MPTQLGLLSVLCQRDEYPHFLALGGPCAPIKQHPSPGENNWMALTTLLAGQEYSREDISGQPPPPCKSASYSRNAVAPFGLPEGLCRPPTWFHRSATCSRQGGTRYWFRSNAGDGTCFADGSAHGMVASRTDVKTPAGRDCEPLCKIQGELTMLVRFSTEIVLVTSHRGVQGSGATESPLYDDGLSTNPGLASCTHSCTCIRRPGSLSQTQAFHRHSSWAYPGCEDLRTDSLAG